MEDVHNKTEERKTSLQDLLFSVEKFQGHNIAVGHDINSREQQENNARTNQQEQQAPKDVIYDNGTAQQHLKQNQYEVDRTDTGSLAAATGMTYMPSIRELGYLESNSFVKERL